MKKVIVYLMAGIMVLSVLAGCGAEKSGGNGESGVTLTWYIPGEKQQDTQLVMDEANKIIEEKIGAKLNIHYIDQGAYTERMNMNMASAAEYDICFTGYINPYKDAVTKGGLMALDELLEKYPHLKNSIPDYAWDTARYNGKVYAVPNVQVMATPTCLVIKKDLAEKYNLDTSKIQKTTDIEPFLEQVKNNESDIIPFRTNWGIASFRSLDETVHCTGQQIYEMTKENGKYVVKPSYEIGDAKEKAKILYDWFQKGYIRKDVASVMDDSQDAKMGKYAVEVTGYKPGIEGERKMNNGFDVVTAVVSPVVMNMSEPGSALTGISRTCKHPEKALELIQLVNTDKELFNLLCFGIEGKHYNKVGENRIELIENGMYKSQSAWKYGNQFHAYLLPSQEDDTWEKTIEQNDKAEKIGIPGLKFERDAVKTQLAQCESVRKEFAVINNGADNPDTYFDSYEKKMKEAGVMEIVENFQKQIDDFEKQNQ